MYHRGIILLRPTALCLLILAGSCTAFVRPRQDHVSSVVGVGSSLRQQQQQQHGNVRPRSVVSFPYYDDQRPASPSNRGLHSIFGDIGFDKYLGGSTDDNDDERAVERGQVPFIVERIEKARETEFREISEMCIEVFFNAPDDNDEVGASKKLSPQFTKGWQLGYLRSRQYSDLRARMFMGGKSSPNSDMFIARRVVPNSPAAQKRKLAVIDDTSTIVNGRYLPPSDRNSYVGGEIVGFCEVSARRVGLPRSVMLDCDDTRLYDDECELLDDENKEEAPQLTKNEPSPYRPLLTNLAVKEVARRSGVGSRLVVACEDIVASSWDSPYAELLLQVEDDNPNAVQFYEKRGYKIMYSDPATRRYDTSGLFLKEVRSTKVLMRKSLVGKRAVAGGGPNLFGEGVNNLMKAVRNALASAT